jgi:hypothetical protein
MPTGTSTIFPVRRTRSPSREQAHADGHLDDLPGAAHQVALADVVRLAHHGDADVVGLEVQHHARNVAREAHELAGQRGLQAVDAGDAVTDREHGAGLGHVDLAAVLLDLALQDVGDFTGS